MLRLAQRALLRVESVRKDAAANTKLLQSVVSNDVTGLAQRGDSVFAGVFTAQGRLLYETHVARLDERVLLLECDAQAVDEVAAYIGKFDLRRKVGIEPMPAAAVWFAPAGADGDTAGQEGVVVTRDARSFAFPAAAQAASRVYDLGGSGAVAGSADATAYDTMLATQGIAEGIAALEPGKHVPIECNLDLLHGISFTKGCYIGQELNARTHFKGVVRKRIVPIQFEDGAPVPEPGAQLAGVGSRRSGGTVLLRSGQTALAMGRLAELQSGVLDADGQATGVVAVPGWWPDAERAKVVSTE